LPALVQYNDTNSGRGPLEALPELVPYDDETPAATTGHLHAHAIDRVTVFVFVAEEPDIRLRLPVPVESSSCMSLRMFRLEPYVWGAA